MTTSRPPCPDHRGRVLAGRYRLDAILGRGGTADVYAAVDLALGRPVAVKVIRPEHARAEAQRLRIHQEAALAAQIDHPNVAAIFDVGEDATAADGERLVFLVMPRLAGGTLRELARAGAMRWPRALSLARQLLAGLAAVHARGVIHRDLKATNCVVSPDEGGGERLRLVDFGLARVIAPGGSSWAPASSAGCIVGTLAYLSPEQARGLAVDVRSDLYSVGVILFEALTQRLPFVGSDYDVLTGHVDATPPSLRALAPAAAIPAEVEAAVLRALAKAPGERFGSAVEFSAALAEAMAAAGEGARARLQACPEAHVGCDEAQGALAAWTRFEYAAARRGARAAARSNLAWSPLNLLMSLTPEE